MGISPMDRRQAAKLNVNVPAPMRGKLACDRIDRARLYIEENLSGTIRLSELASVAAMSPFHFSRSFKRLTGVSPMRYILERRVEASKVMLETTAAQQTEIAYACGFASQSHFCTSFKSITGMTTTAWRQSVMKCAATLGVLWNGVELMAGLQI